MPRFILDLDRFLESVFSSFKQLLGVQGRRRVRQRPPLSTSSWLPVLASRRLRLIPVDQQALLDLLDSALTVLLKGLQERSEVECRRLGLDTTASLCLIAIELLFLNLPLSIFCHGLLL